MKKTHKYVYTPHVPLSRGDERGVWRMVLRRKVLLFSLLFLLVALPVFYLVTKYQSKVEAAWMNDNWLYRKAVAIPSHTALETNVYVTVPAFDATDTSKFQADCGDLRFTKQNGEQLPYFVVDCDATANIHVQFDSLPAGASTYYMYYGNPSVTNGFSSADFATAATGLGTQALATEEKSAGPIAYWKFDEGYGSLTKNSTTISALNATLGTNASWKTEDQCISGKCIYIDDSGSSTWQTVYTSDHSSLGGMSALTVGIWIKTVSNKATQQVVYKRNSGASPAWWSYKIELNSLKPTFYVINSSATSVSSQSDTVIELNKWYYLTGVYDGSQVQIYVNGKAADSTPASLTGTVIDTDYNLQIGGLDTASSYYVKGYLDDVKIYPYARSVAQIKSDFASKGSGSVKGTSVQMGTNAKNNNALSDGLFNYWKMDEATWSGTVNEVIDSSGNGKHGVAGGAAGGKAYPTVGKFGNAAYFDGVDDYIDNPDYKPNSDNFTLAAWFNLSSADSASSLVHSIFGSNQGIATLGYTPSTKVFAHFRQYTGGSETVSFSATSSNLADSLWHHVVLTVDQQTYKTRLYVDGVFLQEKSIGTEGYTHSNGDFQKIGISYIPYQNTYWKGLIDEVRVYKRTLSAEEVRDLYNWAPGPVGYWNMDEKTGQTVNDISGNGYSGTLGLNSSINTDDPTWTAGKFGAGLSFDGGDYVAKGTGPTIVNSVSFWTYPTSTTNYFVDLNGSAYISATSGTLSATGFTSPTIYVNGVVSSTIVANQWQYVTVTTATNLNASALNFGKISTNYFAGKLDEVKLYSYARNSKQIVEDMNAGHPVGGSPVGSQIAYYKFDEGYGITANNSGNGGSTYNGTLGASTAAPKWTNESRISKGLVYDGINDYVSLGTLGGLSGNSETVSFWAKTSAFTDFSPYIDSSFGGSAGTVRFAMGYYYSSAPYFYVFVGDGTATEAFNFNYSIPLNTWKHYTITLDGTSLKLYIDGKLLSTKTTTKTLAAGSYTIGRGFGGAGFLNGQVDEVKIYNAALTSDEVKLDYNRGAAMVLGTMSDTSGLAGGSVASSSASAEHCIPGDTAICNPPVGEWKFEEGTGISANDTSGNGNSGAITGATWVPGQIGKGLNFNGTSDYVRVTAGSGATLDLDSNPITIEAWIKPHNVSANQMVIARGQYGTNGYAIRLNSTGKFNLGSSGGSNFDGLTSLVNNQWYHVVGVINGASSQLYMNGKLDQTGTVNVVSSDLDLYLGADWDGSTQAYFFDGIIDQARVFNYARSPAQIAWDYNRGAPVGWWKMDECQGITANDSSGNGNAGTITIGATVPQTSAGTCTDGLSTSAWNNGKTGKYNSSLNFDGTDDLITIPNSSALQTSTLTFSAWIKHNGTCSGSWCGIVERLGGVTTGNANRLLVTAGSNLIVQDSGTVTRLTSNTTFSTGTWYFITVTISGGIPTLYVNGTLDKVGTSGTFNTGSNDIYLGRGSATSSTYWFAGQIDDVRVYNYALTPQQIKMVYNNGAAIQFAPATGSP